MPIIRMLEISNIFVYLLIIIPNCQGGSDEVKSNCMDTCYGVMVVWMFRSLTVYFNEHDGRQPTLDDKVRAT